MKTGHILLLCILAAALVSTVVCHSGPIPNECCFEYYSTELPQRCVQSYFVTDRRCAKRAVILVSKRSRRICVDPNLSWVEAIMKYVDKRSF